MTLILSGSNGVSDVDGTAATPAIRGTDANTGIFFPAADTLGASVGGSEGLRLTSTGLGIGTSSPAYKLDITSASDASLLQIKSTASANGTAMRLGIDGDNAFINASGASTGALQLRTYGTTQATLDASGNLGLGVTPSAWSQGKAFEISAVGEGLWGNGLGDIWMLNGAYFNGGFKYSGSTKATAYRQGAGVADGSHSWHVAGTGTAGNAITFTQAMTLDASGNLSNTTTASNFSFTTINSNATPYGVLVAYAQDPNGTGSEFFIGRGDYDGTPVNRILLRSNGGIANYQGNDVNLSDRREKTNFAPAKSYLETICAIPVQTFNYIDQNLEEDPGLTLGVVAQDVQAVAPELVMESNWGTKDEPKMRLSIYQTDLQYALMKCIQEQQAIIQALTERVAALEAK